MLNEPLDLHQAIRHAVEVSTSDIESKTQRLTVQLNAKEHQLRGDTSRLQQAFWNILKNASKFTPEGGAIQVSSRNEPGRIVVEVSDTGIGFEAEEATRIFNAFEQANDTVMREYGGLGLGLAITKATVDAHGGVLRAGKQRARSGRGLHGGIAAAGLSREPWKTVPVSSGASPSAKRDRKRRRTTRVQTIQGSMSDPQAPEPPRALRIIVVENHADTLKWLSLYLEIIGHRVVGVKTVAQAHEALAKDCYDVLISDIGLPDGTGWELLQNASPNPAGVRDCHERFWHERGPRQEQGGRLPASFSQALRA